MKKELGVNGVLICDQVIQEKDTAKNTLVAVYSLLYSRSFPTIRPSLTLFFRVVGEPNTEAAAAVKILGPSELKFEATVGRILIGPYGQADVTINIPNMLFPGPGEYAFHVLLNGKEVDRALLWAQTLPEVQARGDPAGQ